MKNNSNSSRHLYGCAVTIAFALQSGTIGADTADAVAAASGSSCTAARPFYWEIGQSSGSPVVSGQVGGTDYARTTTVALASASKWIFGAYVTERYSGIPTGSSGDTIVASLKMLEGHTSFNPLACKLTFRVNACQTIGDNEDVDTSKIGDFNYGGGDGQYAAADSGLLNLGTKTKAQLLSEINSYLSLGSSFAYSYPSVSGGMEANAEDYASFLQGLMSGSYVMSSYLGYDSEVTQCTNCYSPFGTVDMHYSLHHWVEDYTGGQLPSGAYVGTGDGSYSSPGGFGFYPWITSDKSYYGIISMEGNSEDGFVCGTAIREAFFQ